MYCVCTNGITRTDPPPQISIHLANYSIFHVISCNIYILLAYMHYETQEISNESVTKFTWLSLVWTSSRSTPSFHLFSSTARSAWRWFLICSEISFFFQPCWSCCSLPCIALAPGATCSTPYIVNSLPCIALAPGATCLTHYLVIALAPGATCSTPYIVHSLPCIALAPGATCLTHYIANSLPCIALAPGATCFNTLHSYIHETSKLW